MDSIIAVFKFIMLFSGCLSLFLGVTMFFFIKSFPQFEKTLEKMHLLHHSVPYAKTRNFIYSLFFSHRFITSTILILLGVFLLASFAKVAGN